MFLWYSSWDVFQQGMFLSHVSQENVDISKIFGGEASYFSSCSSAKYFVILGGGSGIHKWHSCGRHISCWLLPALLLGGRPGTSTRLCPSMLRVKHGAGAVQSREWDSWVVTGMWLPVYKPLKYLFLFFCNLFICNLCQKGILCWKWQNAEKWNVDFFYELKIIILQIICVY